MQHTKKLVQQKKIACWNRKTSLVLQTELDETLAIATSLRSRSKREAGEGEWEGGGGDLRSRWGGERGEEEQLRSRSTSPKAALWLHGGYRGREWGSSDSPKPVAVDLLSSSMEVIERERGREGGRKRKQTKQHQARYECGNRLGEQRRA